MIFKGILKYPLKNAIYIIILIIAHTTIMLLVNTYFIEQRIIQNINVIRQSLDNSAFSFNQTKLFEVQNIVHYNITGIMPMIILLILLCIIIVPFLQYLLSIGRGYEVGILRTLGLSKGKAWLRLLIENTLLMGVSLIFSFCTMLFFYKPFAFSFLGIDYEIEKILYENFSEPIFNYDMTAFYLVLCFAVIILLVSSALSNVLISNCKPLKLIQKHK